MVPRHVPANNFCVRDAGAVFKGCRQIELPNVIFAKVTSGVLVGAATGVAAGVVSATGLNPASFGFCKCAVTNQLVPTTAKPRMPALLRTNAEFATRFLRVRRLSSGTC